MLPVTMTSNCRVLSIGSNGEYTAEDVADEYTAEDVADEYTAEDVARHDDVKLPPRPIFKHFKPFLTKYFQIFLD